MAISKFVRGLTAASLMGASLVGASMFGVSPASATASLGGSWSSSAPSDATGVSAKKEKDFGKYTLQLRYGRYGGQGWIWARITGIETDLSAYIVSLKVTERATGKTASSWKAVNGKRTTYTNAYRYRSNHVFQACYKHNNLGGTPVCISHTT
ncbi:hypothetical protein AB0I81_09465 [Nonomuraea sp. NPDC050404]|uniref:hypothetical protein n=1 Tax=Nonomuraea sp. NPDC050404 TaxID=3155783 RepID=UPI0033F34D7E